MSSCLEIAARGEEGILSQRSTLPPRSQPSAHSSIQLLVPDILAEIFAWTLPETYTVRDWNKSAPINVAAVCHLWRDVAFSRATLWSTFKVSEEYFSVIPWKWLFTFLRRSGDAPLTLKLSIRSDSKEFKTLTSLIDDHRYHCKYLDITTWDATENPNAPPIFADVSFLAENDNVSLVFADMPVLETFHLNFSNGVSQARVDLSHAPFLRELDLRGTYSLNFGGTLAHNLTSVTMHPKGGHLYALANDCLALLQNSPALTLFRAAILWAYPGNNVPTSENSSSVCNPDLTTLALHVSDASCLRYISQRLNLPSLKNLTVTIGIPDADIMAVSSLLSRSLARVENLDLQGSNMSEIIQCLELSPTLHAITLSQCESDGTQLCDLIRCLTLKPEEQLCAELESIKFEACPELYECTEELDNMIISRWDPQKGPRYLRKVSLFNCFMRETPRIIQCRKEGLILDIRSEQWYDDMDDMDEDEEGEEDYDYDYDYDYIEDGHYTGYMSDELDYLHDGLW